MKQRCTFLVCCLLFSLKNFSQPILNKANGFQDGSLVQLHVDTNPALNEGNGGADQTWDFSSLTDLNPTTDFTGIAVELTPYSDQFPMADVASMSTDLSENDDYNYFTNDDTYYTTWGYETVDQKLIYSDPRDILHYPFTYGDSFTDSYYASLLVGYNSGIVEITADGYGTLKLPAGTFLNCLRVKEVRRDTLADSPTPTTTNDTSFKYYVGNYPEPLCQVNHHHSSDGFDFNEIYWQNISPNAIALIQDSTPLFLFPNPCNNILNVSCPLSSEIASITVTDASGRILEKISEPISEIVELSTLSLADGIYFLGIETKTKKYAHSFVVNRN